MKLQSISLVAALCLVASVVASPVPKEEKRVAKPHHDKRAPKHTKRNALGKRGYEKDYYDDDYYYDDDSYSYDDDYYYDDDYDYSYSYDDDYYYDDYDYYGKGKSSYKKRDAAPKPLNKRGGYSYYGDYDYYDDDYYYSSYDDYDYDDYYYDDDYDSYGKGKSSYKKRDAAPKPLNKRGGYSYYDDYDYYDDYYYSSYDDYDYYDDYYYDDDYDYYGKGKSSYKKRDAAPHSHKRAAKHQ